MEDRVTPTHLAEGHHTPVHDLETPDDVAEMVRRFYQDVAQDSILGPIFNDVAEVDWPEHLPKLTLFWCRALFGIRGYSGNPYKQHSLIHAQHPFTPEAFHRWLELFFDTIDGGWVGPNVERAKSLVRNVARVHSQQLMGEAIDTTRYGGDLDIAQGF